MTLLSRLRPYYRYLVIVALVVVASAVWWLAVGGRTDPAPPTAPGPTAAAVAEQPATATPSPTASPTPTATATSSPTVTPTFTPTPRPPQLLEEARRLQHNGDYSAAAATFQDFLSRYPGLDSSGEAAFGLGQVLWLDGQTAAAAAAFSSIAPDDSFALQHPELYYWLGRAFSALGEEEKAVAAFQTFAERRPRLADWAYQSAGEAYAAALDPENAIALFRRALAAAPDLPATLRAREGIAAASIDAGDLAGARAQYDAILAEAQNPTYRAEILYLRGQALQADGLLSEAYASFLQAMRSAVNSPYAYLALLSLDNAGQPVDDLLRGRVSLAAEAYQPAIAALYRYLDNDPGHDGEAHVLAAQAYEALGNYDAAAVEWRKIVDTHPGDRRVGEAWLGLARGRWRQNDPGAARALYLQAADARPDPASAAEALWWAGVLAERDEETLLDAATYFQRLAETYPDDERSNEAAFRAGLSLYQAGELAQALARWRELAAAGDGFWNAGAAYWLGKALLAQGDEAAALAQWRSMSERWGEGNYYGLRAAQRMGTLTPAATATPAVNTSADLSAWLATWLPLQSPPDLDQSPPELARPTQLHEIGELAAARIAFESLRQHWQEDAADLLRLALRTRDLGYYDISIRAAARVQTLSGRALVETPRALQTLIYPTYYEDLILPAARQHGIEPALFFALVRQESLFGAGAASTAAARGLSQIIPSTGRAIAERMNWQDYSTELLYRPYVNVAFGAFYLAEGLEGAGGNVLQALAGYNGGPGNAAFWRRQAGPDDDLFVELVSFEETQTYLRVITVQARHYRRLYPWLAAADR